VAHGIEAQVEGGWGVLRRQTTTIGTNGVEDVVGGEEGKIVLAAAMAVVRRLVTRYSLGALYVVDEHDFAQLRDAVKMLDRTYTPIDDTAGAHTAADAVAAAVDAVAVCELVVRILGALSLLRWTSLVLYSASTPEGEDGTNGSQLPSSLRSTRDAPGKVSGNPENEDDVFSRAFVDPYRRAMDAASLHRGPTHNTLLQQALRSLARDREAASSAASGSDEAGSVTSGSDTHTSGAEANIRFTSENAVQEDEDNELFDSFVQQGRDSWTYVQGAGDDEESWASQLTPTMLWTHALELLAARASTSSRRLQRIKAPAALLHQAAAALPAERLASEATH